MTKPKKPDQTEAPPILEPPVLPSESQIEPQDAPSETPPAPPAPPSDDSLPQNTRSDAAPESFGEALEAQEKKRGRGRPPKDKTGEAPSAKPKAAVDPEVKKAREKLCREAGIATARMALGSLAAFGGPGFVLDPALGNEKQAIDMATANTGEYFVYKNWGDVSPGVGLMVGWGMVALAIMNKAENKPKVTAFKERILAKIQNWKAEKAERKAAAA